jgi:hypothetical protein
LRGSRLLLLFAGIVALLLAHTSTGRKLILPEAEQERQARRIVRLKKKAARRGKGIKSQVVVQLLDGTWLRGNIVNVKGDILELISPPKGSLINVDFSRVKQIS